MAVTVAFSPPELGLRTLKQSDRGHQVRILQALLRIVGEDVAESGVFDYQTKLVLMRYQRTRGIEVGEMGKADPATWTALLLGETDEANPAS